jgi:uncharacterized MAPEG superfamily protein
METMTRELFWLTLTVIFTGLLWIPYILNRCQVRGLSGAMANPSRNDKPHAEWATRMMFAHDNAIENLIIFAPLVLILAQLDYSTKWTVYACAVYFWSRVAHLIVYTIGLPVFRTLAFTAGRSGAGDFQGGLRAQRVQRLLRARTNSISAILSSKPLTSPVSIDSSLQSPASA